jgi:sulfite reductase alpha subunit-like flavoprotein
MVTGEQVAERVLALGYTTQLHGLEEVGDKWDLAAASTLIIASSATGDGEQPENVIKLWQKVRPKSLPLSPLQCTLHGLVDTNYDEFCGGPRTMHRRLAELGAACCRPPEPGLEVAVKPWLEDLWPALARAAGDTVPGLEAALDKLEKHLAVRAAKEFKKLIPGLILGLVNTNYD